MRNHVKLDAFRLADELVLKVYQATAGFPKTEVYGLTSQIRRAAVSVSANIAEGSARRTTNEYRHFLSIANGSLAEVGYYIELSRKLSYLSDDDYPSLRDLRFQTSRTLSALIRSLPPP